jgi:hypothetical protein
MTKPPNLCVVPDRNTHAADRWKCPSCGLDWEWSPAFGSWRVAFAR